VVDSNGWYQGTLDAQYRSGSKKERTIFTFGGRIAANGVARFPWTSSDGRRGQIEFVRVPGAQGALEVVWYGADVKRVFDEIVRKSN